MSLVLVKRSWYTFLLHLMASAAAVVVDAAVVEAADDDGSFPKVVRDKCTYISCYCEENVWKLVQCKELAKVTDRLYVVFISNPSECSMPA